MCFRLKKPRMKRSREEQERKEHNLTKEMISYPDLGRAGAFPPLTAPPEAGALSLDLGYKGGGGSNRPEAPVVEAPRTRDVGVS